MASGKTEASINCSPDDAWKLLREFGGLGEWMPGVETCTLDGDVRTIGMMGIEIKEQLRSLDDENRRIVYGIVESPMGNLEHHEATIAIDPEGEGSHITYSVDVTPDELLGMFLPIYEGSVAEIKKKLEA